MPFPESPHVIYGKNALAEVFCQFRFPPILRIDAEPPVQFQEAVREHFPLYSNALPVQSVPFGLPAEMMKMLAGASAMSHEFQTADGAWKLALTRDFLALTTTKYETFRDFKERLRLPFAALLSVYKPAFFLRSGLRYRNVIDRAAFGLSGAPWRDLLSAHAAGELGQPAISDHVRHILREVIIELADGRGRVRIVHGLQREPSQTETYVIDSDFYSETQTQAEGAIDVLEHFNSRAGRLFRWYISDRLHEAMAPHPAD
jgi:uncharacterized protein (TIGR04255 family)